jgi:NAD(P)-dependent dehydrogenase (short-subunit alcohol dehydrogenase family)
VSSLRVKNDEGTVAAAYITGASRGIGRLLATALARSGVPTVGFARPSTDLNSLPDEAASLVAIPMDVTDQASVTSAFHQAVDTIGPPTLLVTCAGSIDPLGPIATIDADVRGTMLCVHAAVPYMLEQGTGRIVTIYGNLGDDGREHVSAFAAAKAAVARFTETLATELAGTGVLAICVHPGFVRTPMTEHMAFDADGQRWLPTFGRHAPDRWTDGTQAIQLIEQISAGRADGLAGRIVHVDDDLDALTLRCQSDHSQRRLRIFR